METVSIPASLDDRFGRVHGAVQSAGGVISDTTSDGDDLGPRTEAIPGQSPAKFPAQGAPTSPAPVEVRPTGWLLAGRYRIQQRIGAGGMAEVFQAGDELLARDVAVKVFRRHPDAANGAGGPKRQSVELQALARLSHPNLISLFDGSIGEDGEPAYLVMELVHGPSLAARIAEAPLSPDEAAEIAEQLADALSYVHSRDMVHRDIKPANILLGVDGVTGDAAVRARLSDFGIVRLLGSERLTSVDFMVGTASYLAPEQARGADVGPAADVYALGLVLLEALTGVRAYDGSMLDAVTARLERSPEIPQHFPAPWPGLLQAMTAIEPDLRPSAAEVGRVLRAGRFASLAPAGVDGEPTDAARTAVPAEFAADPVLPSAATGAALVTSSPGQPSRRLSTRGLLAAATVVLAAAAVIEGLLLSHHSTPAPAPLTAPTVARSPVTPPSSGTPQPIAHSSGAVSSTPPEQTFAATSLAVQSSAAATSEVPSVSVSVSAPSAAPVTRTVTATATAPAASPTASASPSSSATTATATTSASATTSSSPSVPPSATTSGVPSPATTSPAVVKG